MIVQYVYIVQEESANKVINNYDNAKCEIKSHTSSYANMLPSEKLISDSPSRTEISSGSKVALRLSLSSASCR